MRLAEISSFLNADSDDLDFDYVLSRSAFEANVVTKGVVGITVNEKPYRLCPGDIMIRSVPFYNCTRTAIKENSEFTVIRFNSSVKDLSNDFCGLFRLNHDSAMLNMVLSHEIGQNGISDVANDIFEALLIRCLREKDTAVYPGNSSSMIYRDAISYMNKNMNVILSVPEIAHNCSICETTLKNAFRHHTGKSVKRYYSDLKIEKASELLRKGINAKEVAATLGFSTLSYFSQFFKRETGCSIRDYMKQNPMSE